MFFYLNVPGLMYAGMLIERMCGPAALIGAYLFNCGLSAATTTAVHRQIGYHKVQQRGRLGNTNGNTTLFLTSLFTAMAPEYKLYQGSFLNITFLYIVAFYAVLFFM